MLRLYVVIEVQFFDTEFRDVIAWEVFSDLATAEQDRLRRQRNAKNDSMAKDFPSKFYVLDCPKRDKPVE
jgi:hypothetical protein